MNFTKKVPLHTLLYILSGCILLFGLVVLFYPRSTNTPESLVPTAQQIPNPPKTNTGSVQKEVTYTQDKTFAETLRDAKSLEEEGKFEDALVLLTKAQKKTTDPYVIPLKQAELFVKMKNFTKAVEVYDGVLGKNPSLKEALIGKLQAKLQGSSETTASQVVGEVESAIRSFSEQTKESLFMLCIISGYQNKKEEVSLQCQKVKDLMPGTKESTLAHALIDHYFVFSTFKDGSDAYLRALHAKTITDAGFHALAISLLRSILAEDSSYRDAWTLLGYNYLALDKNSLALGALESAYTLDTTKAYIQYLLGVAHDRLGNREKAISYYAFALGNQFEKEREVRSRLAELYVDNKNYDLAVDQYRALFTAQKPTSPEAYSKLMWIYIDILKEPVKALDMAISIQKQFPESALADNFLGWAYAANNKKTEARMALERGLKKDGALPALYLNLGKLEQAEGNMEQAKIQFMQAYERGKGTEIGDMAGKLYNALSLQKISS